MLRQTSLATLGMSLGSILTAVGFIAYFANNPTLNLVGFFYGFPLLLGGLALKGSELKPIPFSQPTGPNILELRNQQATKTQTKLRKDLTGYKYGQDAHLDRALAQVGLSPTEEKRPVITGIRETEVNGAYTLVLEFDSPLLPMQVWEEQLKKIETFFGPGIKAELHQPEDNRIELSLIASPG
ncbi:DUF2854 domain-containing protein [Aerosakkonemataceae cyanobacterium BLCC-F50]|uniref:DUF2854 domain-containing protein n=1 Tax=Floridaenema flaviceps BLCC-F50 TaxID=3153642 RepID=A0ABV4XQM6_9CYAN